MWRRAKYIWLYCWPLYVSFWISNVSSCSVSNTFEKTKKTKGSFEAPLVFFLTREEWEEITGDGDQGLVSGLLSLKIFLCVDFHCSHGGKTETNSSSTQHFHSALPPSVQRVLKWQSSCTGIIRIITCQQRSSTERGCSSNGRALALHARGTGFDPPHLHFLLF